MNGTEQNNLIQELAECLLARNETLGTAESCTGGMIAADLTAMPGASAWFFGGIIAYDNSIKTTLLNVPEAILREYGAVSKETALIMADSARARLRVHHALSVTGIAGPSGGSPEKPVGTVWIGYALNGALHAQRHLFPGSRADIRKATAHAALFGLLQHLKQERRAFA